MAFISIDKMKALREAARNGDERAKRILKMQVDGEDFSSLLDEHFATVEQPIKERKRPFAPKGGSPLGHEERLRKFLDYNGVKEGDPEYESTLEAYYQEFPKARPAKEAKATDADIRLPDDDDGHSIYGEEDEEIRDEAEPAKEPGDGCFIDALIADEIEAIEAYNKAIMDVMGSDSQSDAVKKGLMADLEEIRKDEIEHLEKLKRMKNSIEKKEESEEIPPLSEERNGI